MAYKRYCAGPTRGGRDQARVGPAFQEWTFSEEKRYTHETIMKGIGQFIFEDAMNNIPLEQRRQNDYFPLGALKQASGRKRHLSKAPKRRKGFQKVEMAVGGLQTRGHKVKVKNGKKLRAC